MRVFEVPTLMRNQSFRTPVKTWTPSHIALHSSTKKGPGQGVDLYRDHKSRKNSGQFKGLTGPRAFAASSASSSAFNSFSFFFSSMIRLTEISRSSMFSS